MTQMQRWIGWFELIWVVCRDQSWHSVNEWQGSFGRYLGVPSHTPAAASFSDLRIPIELRSGLAAGCVLHFGVLSVTSTACNTGGS